MGLSASKPTTVNTQSVIIGKSKMTKLELHQDTLWYVMIIVVIAFILALIAWFLRKYKRKAMHAKPYTAAKTLRQLEAQHQAANLHPTLPTIMNPIRAIPKPSMPAFLEYRRPDQHVLNVGDSLPSTSHLTPSRPTESGD